jgi:hypothetical protein
MDFRDSQIVASSPEHHPPNFAYAAAPLEVDVDTSGFVSSLLAGGGQNLGVYLHTYTPGAAFGEVKFDSFGAVLGSPLYYTRAAESGARADRVLLPGQVRALRAQATRLSVHAHLSRYLHLTSFMRSACNVIFCLSRHDSIFRKGIRRVRRFLPRILILLLVLRVIAAPVTLSRVTSGHRETARLTVRLCSWPASGERSHLGELKLKIAQERGTVRLMRPPSGTHPTNWPCSGLLDPTSLADTSFPPGTIAALRC